MDLTNKRILVTGASSGIGRETSILLSKLGAQVIMIARREKQLIESLNELEGKNHKFYCQDLNQIDEIESLINKIVTENGAIDGFVHSAGVGKARPLKMLKYSFIKDVMDINFFSFVEISRCITRKKYYNEGMSIVGVSSVSSIQGNQSKIAYCASKAAMDAAIRCMAKELSPKKIRVNSVMPGLVNTGIYDSFLDEGSGSKDAEDILARQYLGIGEPIDIANMICYLISVSSKFITGTSIAIDGGRSSS